VQDGGRPGWAHVGVTRSGAADRVGLHAANRLVGNHPDAAAVEVTLGGCTFVATVDLTVAVAGAECPVWLGGRREPAHAVLTWRAGTELRLGVAERGVRAYVAVRGGLLPRRVLGSASTDVLGGLGPAALRTGDRVPVGASFGDWPQVDLAAVGSATVRAAASIGAAPLEVAPGPRVADDPLLQRAFEALLAADWAVAAASDRVGVRLAALGRVAAEAPPGTAASDGIVRGAVQWPPSAAPVVFLADHPVTGGYPVVGCLTGWGTDVLAQARPGDPVRFRRAPR
jgi:biotin-dependent carboxylase-like uncharacterized protein